MDREAIRSQMSAKFHLNMARNGEDLGQRSFSTIGEALQEAKREGYEFFWDKSQWVPIDRLEEFLSIWPSARKAAWLHELFDEAIEELAPWLEETEIDREIDPPAIRELSKGELLAVFETAKAFPPDEEPSFYEIVCTYFTDYLTPEGREQADAQAQEARERAKRLKLGRARMPQRRSGDLPATEKQLDYLESLGAKDLPAGLTKKQASYLIGKIVDD